MATIAQQMAIRAGVGAVAGAAIGIQGQRRDRSTRMAVGAAHGALLGMGSLRGANPIIRRHMVGAAIGAVAGAASGSTMGTGALLGGLGAQAWGAGWRSITRGGRAAVAGQYSNAAGKVAGGVGDLLLRGRMTPGRAEFLRTAATFGAVSFASDLYDQSQNGFGRYDMGRAFKSGLMGSASGASFAFGGKGYGRVARTLVGAGMGAAIGGGSSTSQAGGAVQGAILGAGFGAGAGRAINVGRQVENWKNIAPLAGRAWSGGRAAYTHGASLGESIAAAGRGWNRGLGGVMTDDFMNLRGLNGSSLDAGRRAMGL